MVGFYNKAAPDSPPLVRAVDRLLEHRNTVLLVAAGILGALIGLSIFLPKLGLSLLAVAVVTFIGLVLVVRSQGSYRTHWTRESRRR